jgi:3-isopropylmalate/(R)-2-methylmalate dehydratase small subunit
VERLERVHGIAAPLLVENVDTDTITPMHRILEGGDALVRYAFEPLRFREDGSPHPDFSLDQPRYEGAKILIAGANFGCGSSRETAVWAVAGMGFRVLIAPSFGDIFFQNAFKNGMLPIVLPPETVEHLASLADGAVFDVDLAAQTIRAPDGRTTPFEVNAFRKQGLLRGADDLELVLDRAEAIRAFQARDRELRPWAWREPGS